MATTSLIVGERVRQALLEFTSHPVVSGKTLDGEPIQAEHLRFLPEISPNHRICSILLSYRKTIPYDVIRAIQQMRECYNGHNPRIELQLTVSLMGAHDVYGYDIEQSVPIGGSPLLGRSTHWVSQTPIILQRFPRFHKMSTGKNDLSRPILNDQGLQKDGLEEQIEQNLLNQGFPRPVFIRPATEAECGSKFRWKEYRNQRVTGTNTRATGWNYGALIQFEQPVQGPISMGYGGYYGLGMFKPVHPDSIENLG